MTKDRSSYLTIPSASPAKQATGFPDDGMIDNLTYAYNGNQLQSVHDVNDPNHQNNGFTDDGSFATTEYQYDSNGNMVKDLNKKIDTIVYNHLNLPEQIDKTSPMGHQYEINYLYTASGQKMRKATTTDQTPYTTTDYVGSFIYQDGQLQSILTHEGHVVVDGSSYEYQYFLKDHLGNTRVTFNSVGIIQEDSYYPYGMNMAGLSHESGEDLPNKYRYNGKELQDDFGLDWYDYGARFYDPSLGRFMVQDKYAEVYYLFSPYSYCAGNPIKNVDVNGEFIGTIIGTVVGAAAGAYDSYQSGGDMWAGAAEGAVSGAIAGAAVDLVVAATVATGGGALVVIGAGAAAGAIGGAAGAVAGDATGQVVTSVNKGSSVSDAVSNISTENMVDKATTGAITGAL